MVSKRQKVGTILGMAMITVAAFDLGISTAGSIGHMTYVPAWYDWLIASFMLLWGVNRCLNPEYD